MDVLEGPLLYITNEMPEKLVNTIFLSFNSNHSKNIGLDDGDITNSSQLVPGLNT